MAKYLFYFVLLVISFEGISQNKRRDKKAREFTLNGENYSSVEKYDSAAYFYEQAAVLYYKNKDWLNCVKNNKKAAWAFFNKKDYSNSILILRRSLETGIDKLKLEKKENTLELAQVYYLYGRNLLRLNNYDRSNAYYSKGLGLLENIHEKDKSVQEQIATHYHSIGYVYFLKGDYANAIENGNRSLKIRYALYGMNHISVSYSYYNVGTFLEENTDYEKAIEYYESALKIYLNLSGDTTVYLGKIYNNLGVAYFDKGDYDEAYRFWLQFEEICKKLGAENKTDYLLLLNNLGEIYTINQEYDKALRYHQEALERSIKLFGRYDENVAWSYKCLGNVYFKKGAYDFASLYIKDAIEINRHIFGKYHPRLAECYNILGDIFKNSGEYTKADSSYQRAILSNIPFLKNTNALYVTEKQPLRTGFRILSKAKLFDSFEKRASLFYKKFLEQKDSIINLELAVSSYEKALQVLDMMRNNYKSDESKLIVNNLKRRVFDDALKTIFELYEITGKDSYKIYKFIEKSKSNALLSLFYDLKAKQFSTIPPELLEKEKQLKTRLNYYNNLIERSLNNKQVDSLQLNEWENEFISISYQYDTLIKNFEDNYPRYYKLKYQTTITPVDEIQHALKTDEAIVNYYLSGNSIYINVIRKNDYTIDRVKIDSTFNKFILKYFYGVKKGESNPFVQNSVKLYDILIKPVYNHIKTKKKLIIIPDDYLYYIPFETLIDSVMSYDLEELNYMIKNYAISYNYSCAIWRDMREQTGNIFTHDFKKEFTGFAPVFEEKNKEGMLGSPESLVSKENLNMNMGKAMHIINVTNLTPLKYSQEEVKNIRTLFEQKNKTAKIYLNDESNEDTFKEESSKCKYLHIATHGFSNDKQPELSCLAFSQSKDSSVNDGILYADEMYNLDLNCELVVLSSCESGMGKLIKGEGFISMTRGFVYSGARNILFSLWNVSDRYTKDLMADFYKHLMDGENIPNALRFAKLKLLEQNTNLPPYFWSGFVLIGS